MKAFSCALQIAAIVSMALGKSDRITLKQKSSSERAFVDSFGREVFFHGVNAVVKGPPWIPETESWDADISLSDKDFDDLESIGLNVIRLGTMWPGVEPSKGYFSKEYVQKVKTIVDAASIRGIYTLFDMHQDVLSENFCGEGAPDWLIDMVQIPEITFPAPLNNNTSFTDMAANGFPLHSDCIKFDWAEYYSTFDCSFAFDALYNASDSSNGLLQAWSEFWTHLADEFKDNEFVLGYELINEPWAGDVFAKPTLFIPGVADKERLQPAYDVLANEIRAVDNTTLLFFAAVTWDDIVPVGFTAPPAGDAQASKSVFAYHFYEPPQLTVEPYFEQRMKDARRLEVGSMLTEFLRPSNDNDMESDPAFAIMAAADQHLQSWSMWRLKTFCKETNQSIASDSQYGSFGTTTSGHCSDGYLWNSNGTLNANTTLKLARTYALAVAGNTIHMKFDPNSANFTLQYTINTFCAMPTVVFLHEQLQYPNGYQVLTLPEKLVIWNTGTKPNLLEFWPIHINSEEDFGKTVTIMISRA